MVRLRLAVPVCLAGALLLPEISGPMSRVAARPHNLLLITLDTMRADRLPAYGFPGVETPALDRISAEGTVFEEAFAAVPLTLPSSASLFTGLYPPRLGVRDNSSPMCRQGNLALRHVDPDLAARHRHPALNGDAVGV
jgi:arylsulfatase A-like enzyme